MRKFPIQGRTLALLAVVIPLLVLFIYVVLRSGPLAPVAVTVASVQSRAIVPALFGIGTVEARYTYKIGPTVAGRVKSVEVEVGDAVKAGQVLGEMDPVDVEDRVRSQEAAIKRSEATLREAQARQAFARTQDQRYSKLAASRTVSDEAAALKRQERQVADAVVSAARQELERTRSDREAQAAQRDSLRLVAPMDGVVFVRDADPGTTVVAGQPVLQIIDTAHLWVNVRFDQISASGLAAGLPASIVLRSRSGQALKGRVLRVEPMADAVTEEMIAKAVFDVVPQPLPPLGELAEVTVDLPALTAAPCIPNAAIRRDGDRVGVWRLLDGELNFAPVTMGASDLEGFVQVLEGLAVGDQVVVYSEKSLAANSRIHVVDRVPGVAR